MLLSNIHLIGQIPNWLWAKQTTGNGYSYAQDLTYDETNNVYICGYLMGSITFNNQSIFSDNQRAYVAKYNSDGLFQWVITFPSDDGSFASKILIDKDNNVIVAGYFHGTLSIGNLTLTTNATDIYLIKLSPNGNVIWAEQSVCTSLTQANDIKIDDDNNIVVLGYNNVQVSFENLIAEPGMFIVKYNSNGTPIHLINEYACSPRSLDLISDKILVTAAIGDTTIIGNYTLYPTGYYTIDPIGDTIYVMNNDLIFISYGDNGEVNWVKQATSKGHDFWTYSTVDDYSNYYICGEISDTTNFWGTILYPIGNSSIPYLIKTDSLGNIIWLIYGEPVLPQGSISFKDLTIHEDYIYLLGYPVSSSTFANMVISSNYNISTMILKLDLNGNGIWQIFDSTNSAINNPSSIGIDNLDDIVVCGYFEDTVHFGSNYLYSLGGQTLYLTKVSSKPISVEEYNYTDYESILIYPNPSNGSFTLSIPTEKAQVSIYSSSGKLIEKVSFSKKGSNAFQLHESGLYYVNVIIENKTYCQKVIVIE